MSLGLNSKSCKKQEKKEVDLHEMKKEEVIEKARSATCGILSSCTCEYL